MKKNLFSLGLMTAAVIALASCAKEAAAPVVEEPAAEGVPFEIVAGVSTKTAVSPVAGEASVIEWVANDAVNLFVAEHEAEFSDNIKFTVENVEEGRFKGTLKSALDASKTYDWKVFYPFNSKFKLVNTSGSGNGAYLTFGSQTNSSQTQQGNNNSDHLAGSNMPLYGVAENIAGDETPNIVMHQAMSVVKVHVTNKANSALTVTSVAVSAPEGTLINGTFYVDFSGVNPLYTSSGASYTSNTANLAVTEGAAIAKNGTADFYIAVLPFTLASGAKLNVSINGSNIEKTASAATDFEAGMIKTVNVDYTGGPEYTTLTEIFTSSQGTGTYNIQGLLVYAANNSSAILGDADGVKILLYKSGHGLHVGEVVNVTNATIGTYKGNIQITNGTFEVKSTGNEVVHGEPWDLNDETVVAGLPDDSAFFSPFYVTMNGDQSGRNINGEAKLYLDVANAATNGKKVVVAGYVLSYDSANQNHRILAIDIKERMEVSPASLSWKADETDAKTITVNIHDGGDGYTVSPTTDSKFNISDNGHGTITVTPKGKNTSSTDANSLTLTITHKNDADVQATVTCTQAKKSSGSDPVEVTVVIADYADDNNWENGTQYSTVNIDSNITATAVGGSNTGKYYTSGEQWRTYQNETPTITIAAKTGYTIEKVAITYATKNTGVLMNGTNTVNSGAEVSVNAESISFSVGNTGTATNGQVNITQIYVKYSE